MQAQGDSSQHTDGIGQRGRRQGCAAHAIFMGTFVGVGCLSLPFGLLLRPEQSPTRQLAIGGTIYALGILFPLWRGLVLKLPVGLLRHFLESLILSVLLFPTLFASMCIAAALSQLAGWQLDLRGDYLVGLVPYAVLPIVVSIAVYGLRRRFGSGRRTAAHG
jgi:hypothetical protein